LDRRARGFRRVGVVAGSCGLFELDGPAAAPARRNPLARSTEGSSRWRLRQCHQRLPLSPSRSSCRCSKAPRIRLRAPALLRRPEPPTHYELPQFVPGAHVPDPKSHKGESGRAYPGGQRPILARLRRANGRAYGRPDRSGLRPSPTRIGGSWEARGAFRPFRGQGCRGMHDHATDRPEQLLSPDDVARVCGLSRRAVYRAIARGELRAARLCNRLRVQPTELQRWIGELTGSLRGDVKQAPGAVPAARKPAREAQRSD
jgi:excisionase family DNA binding protein